MRQQTDGRFRIRQAGHHDADEMALVLALAWLESYRGVVSDQVLDQRLDPGRLERQAAGFHDVLDVGGYLWVVQDLHDGGRLVGVAGANAARDADAPEPLELAIIYLLDVAKGSGIADRLLQMAIGDAPAYLWVLADNPRALAFYRRHGFVADGVRKSLPPDYGPIDEIRLVRPPEGFEEG